MLLNALQRGCIDADGVFDASQAQPQSAIKGTKNNLNRKHN